MVDNIIEKYQQHPQQTTKETNRKRYNIIKFLNETYVAPLIGSRDYFDHRFGPIESIRCLSGVCL